MKKMISALLLSAAVSNANAIPIDLGLSLVVDVSGSVSGSEYDLQMGGYANAFRSASVQNNILGGDAGAITANVVFFSSSFFTTSLDAFVLLDSVSAINGFADTLDTFARPGGGGTNIYNGTNRAIDLILADTIYMTENWIIDVSGDGTDSVSSNQEARDRAAANNITINGLAIEGSSSSTTITDFYAANVITNNGFVETAAGFDDFQRAVATKLQIETGGGGPSNDVPVPGVIALLVAGFIGLAGTRRKLGTT